MSLFLNKKEMYIQNYNDSIKQISKLHDVFYLEYKAKQQQNPMHRDRFFRLFSGLIVRWQKIPDALRHDIAQQSFLKPLLRLCRLIQPNHNALLILHLTNDCLFELSCLDELKLFIKEGVDFKVDKLSQIEGNFKVIHQHMSTNIPS
jgi:hypothetical protein